MLTKRQKNILLSLNAEVYSTSFSIAEKMKLSDKTIRKEIDNINELSNELGMEIISKKKLGYRLVVLDADLAKEFFDDEEQTEDDLAISIMEHLFLINDYIKVEELGEMLHYSQRSITTELKKVRKILSFYRLKLESKPYYGIRIMGKEFDKRACISCYLDGMTHTKKMLFSEFDEESIKNILKESLSEYGYVYHDNTFNNLIYHIVITARRIENHIPISIPRDKMEEFRMLDTYPLSLTICQKMEEKFPIVFSEEEKDYLALHLHVKKMNKSDEGIVINQDVFELVDDMLQRVDEELGMHMSLDFDVRTGLCMHLVPLIKRIHHHMNLKNPLLDDIRQHFTMAYIVAVTACMVINDRYNVTLSNDEIGYVAMYMNLALAKQQEDIRKKDVVIISSGGNGSAELLAYQYRDNFGKYLKRITTVDSAEVATFDFSNYDVAISTVNVDVKIPIPLIRVKYFLMNSDISLIEKKLNCTRDTSVRSYFKKELFFRMPSMETKEAAIHWLTERMKETTHLPDNFEDLVLLREGKGSTQFGRLTAMPHPYRCCTTKTEIAVLVLEEPVMWDDKVQVIFLVSIGRESREDTQMLYKVLSTFMQNNGLIKKIVREGSHDLLMEIVENIEKENS